MKNENKGKNSYIDEEISLNIVFFEFPIVKNAINLYIDALCSVIVQRSQFKELGY